MDALNKEKAIQEQSFDPLELEFCALGFFLICIIQSNDKTLVQLKNTQGETNFVTIDGEPEFPAVLETTLMILRLKEIRSDLKKITP
jgi:hypothetical protein